MPAVPPVGDPARPPAGSFSLPAAPPSGWMLSPEAPLVPASPALFSLPPTPPSPAAAPGEAIASPPAPGATIFKSRGWLSRSALQAAQRVMSATHAVRLVDRLLKPCIGGSLLRRPQLITGPAASRPVLCKQP